MSEQNNSQDDLGRFRERADRFRQAGRQKGSVTKEVRDQLRALVARLLVRPDVDLERIQADLTQFPPAVVGHAVASQWTSLSSERLAVLQRRLETLDSDRQASERLALALSLLRRPVTKAVAGPILAVLPRTKDALGRVTAEFLSEDGDLLEALEAPADEQVAANLWGVLLKAAGNPKAQEWRRYNLLVKVLHWLEQNGRFERRECIPLISEMRAVRGTLTGRVAEQMNTDLNTHECWSVIVRGAPSEPVTTAGLPVDTPAVEGIVVPPPPLREAEPAMPLADAQTATAERVSRLRQELRAAESLLAAVRASQGRVREITGRLSAARDAERNALVRANETRMRAEALDVEVQKMRAEREEHERRNRELGRQVADLEQRLAAAGAESEGLAKRLRDAEETFAAERKVWEQRVVTNAEARLDEFKRRVGSRLKKLTADVPGRHQTFPDTLTSVLNDRLHEVFDALQAEGITVTNQG